MENRQIRKNAWALYKANFLKMLPAMVLVSFLNFVPGFIIRQAALSGLADFLVTQLSTVLFAPLVLCGAAAFSLDILRGGAPKTHLMFEYARDFRRVMKIWLASLVYYLPGLAVSVITTVRSFYASEDAGAWIGALFLPLALLVLALAIFGLWFSLRLGLFSYSVVKNPEAGAGEWLKSSWRVMKGNCGRQFRLTFSVYWPSVVVGLIIFLIAGRSAAGSAMSLPVLSITIFECFYMGYPMLAQADFADDLLKLNQSL